MFNWDQGPCISAGTWKRPSISYSYYKMFSGAREPLLSRILLNEASQYNYLSEDLVVVVLQIVEGVWLVHLLHVLHVPQTVTTERLIRGDVGKTVVPPFPYKKKYKLLKTFSVHNLPIRRVNYSSFFWWLSWIITCIHELVICIAKCNLQWCQHNLPSFQQHSSLLCSMNPRLFIV